MAKEGVNNIKWIALIGAIVFTTGVFAPGNYIGAPIGSSIVAASLFGCFTALHLHDLRKDDQ